METQQIQQNKLSWMEEEAKQLTQNTKFTGEILPALKLESGKITKFTVDFSQPFNKWDSGNGLKAIIPVTHKGEKKNIWLNVKNPLYGEIIKKGRAGQVEFAVSTTGSLKDTRYTIVEED